MGSNLGRPRRAVLSPAVLRDEVIDTQTHGPRAAVLVVALEVDRVLAFHDLARLRDQKAVCLGRTRRPCVEDQAIAGPAVLERQPSTAFDPGLGFFLRGHGPAHESLNLILAVDREVVVFAIDLAGEDARPVAKPQICKGWLGHQVVHCQTERNVRVLRPEHL